MAFEILCSLLTGMEYGKNISAMFGNPMDEKRKLGHFFIAINISSFVDLEIFKSRMSEMINSLRKEPSLNEKKTIMAPGDPEIIKSRKRKKLNSCHKRISSNVRRIIRLNITSRKKYSTYW